jgi:hypothetical protein
MLFIDKSGVFLTDELYKKYTDWFKIMKHK